VDDHPVAPDPSGADLAGLAVLHQRLAREQHDLLEGMARSFGAVLADAMRIERRGLLNSGRVKAIAITLDDKTFELREERGEIRSSIGHTVGGVVLSRTLRHRRVARPTLRRARCRGAPLRSNAGGAQPPGLNPKGPR
jgi:hypothetical protein